jgi:2'-5' RNA ligase
MPDTTRTFLAVAVPEALEPRVARLRTRLEAEVPEGRWGATRPWHATLAFLGDVPHADLNAVCLAAEETSGRFERFELTLHGVGVFPDMRRPRVVWVGVDGPGLDTLRQLQLELVAALSALGYRPEAQPFRPHVTLGRLRSGRDLTRDLTAQLSQFSGWSAGPFWLDEVVTFASTTTSEGPVYVPLGRARLAERKAHGGA